MTINLTVWSGGVTGPKFPGVGALIGGGLSSGVGASDKTFQFPAILEKLKLTAMPCKTISSTEY